MYTDVHTHIFTPSTAQKTLSMLEARYGTEPVGSGLIDDLLEREKKAGMDRVVIHSAAPSHEHVGPVNLMATHLMKNNENVIAFGTMHPDDPIWEERMSALEHAGVPGIKIHPELQNFRLDDPRLLPMFEAGAGRFIFMVHIGDRLPPEENPSCPYKMAAVLDAVPQTTFIAAHLGGWMHWEHVPKALMGRDIWLDTSGSLTSIDEATLHTIFKGHPRSHILFGSDYPLFDPGDELKLLQKRLHLSDEELDDMMLNADLLFG